MKGLFFIKHWFELLVICSWKLLQVSVGRADQSSDPKCELELRHCVVAETCFVSEKMFKSPFLLLPKIAPSV